MAESPEADPQAEPVLVTMPAVSICKQLLPDAADWEEMTSAEVEAVPVTVRVVEVAVVIERLAIVEEALATKPLLKFQERLSVAVVEAV